MYLKCLTSRWTLGILLLWQLIAVYLMVIGEWPGSVAWINLILLLLYIVLAPTFEGLLLTIASISFYIVLPNHYSDTLSMWRPVVGVLFLRALFTTLTHHSRWLVAAWKRVASGEWRVANIFAELKMGYLQLFTYEKFGIALFILGVLSLVLARYPLRGAMQLVFLLNTFLLYPIVLWVVKSRDQLIRLLKYGALSTGTIIAIGYVQFAITLFTIAYYFWQYWALRVASLFYGLPLAKVLQYSNSWVTVQGESKTLRMFSIMTSSHAFAMVCVFFIAFALPLFFIRKSDEKSDEGNPRLSRGFPSSRWIWAGIVLACLAIIFSGTRGVWAGMSPALLLAGILYYKTRLKAAVTSVFAVMLLIIILFEASPFIDQGLAWVRNGGWRSGTLERVVSIIDTGETSNAGRLDMWKAASRYALHHPLGVGYANFVATLSSDKSISFDQAAGIENEQYRLPQRYVTAHSLYLQLLVELSVVGLTLFGLFWLFYFREAWQFLQAHRDTLIPETIYIASVSLVFFWFLAYGVFDLTWLNDKILLYTFLALALVRIVITKSASSGSVSSPKQ